MLNQFKYYNLAFHEDHFDFSFYLLSPTFRSLAWQTELNQSLTGSYQFGSLYYYPIYLRYGCWNLSFSSYLSSSLVSEYRDWHGLMILSGNPCSYFWSHCQLASFAAWDFYYVYIKSKEHFSQNLLEGIEIKSDKGEIFQPIGNLNFIKNEIYQLFFH